MQYSVKLHLLSAALYPYHHSYVANARVELVNDKTIFVLWRPVIELEHLNCA